MVEIAKWLLAILIVLAVIGSLFVGAGIYYLLNFLMKPIIEFFKNYKKYRDFYKEEEFKRVRDKLIAEVPNDKEENDG